VCADLILFRFFLRQQERIIKEGYLFKSSRETYWRKLYVFVESDAIIFCKKPEHRYNPKSIINWCDIHSVEKIGPEITKKNFCFSITTTRKTWYLFAANESDRDEWIEAMRSKIGTSTDQSNVMAIIPLRTVEYIHTVNSYMYSSGFQVNTRDGQEFYFSSINENVDALKEEILALRDESLKKPQIEDKEEEEDMPPQEEESSGAGLDTKDPTSTENTIFHKRFQLPDTEVLIESYSCSLVRMISHSGRMYVSQNYVCFYSNIFGVKNIVVIPFRDVIQVKKQNSLFLFPNSILIKTKDESFFFNTFLYRHNAFTLLKKCLHMAEQKKGSTSPKLSEYAKVIQEESSDEILASDQNLRFTFMIVGSRGDVQPVIALALRLETYGHKCKIATHEAHRKFVEDNGLAFFPLAGDPKDLMALCVKNDMFSISFFKEALSKFTHFMADLLVTCWDACKTDTDVILENPPCMAGPSIAEKLGIPLIELFTIPWTRTTQFPNPFAVSSAASPIYNYSSFVAMEQGMFQPMRSILNKFRSQVLGLPFLGITDYRIHSDRHIPFLYCWSPSVLPKPHDWPEYIDVTGYWFMEPDKNYKPDPKLVKWLEEGPKPIYIGFGSVTVEDPDGLTKTIFEAVKMSGARAVLSKGWGGMGADEYPDYIFPVDNVPHDWLFPRCAGTIQHGGAGTTAAALCAGIPTMIVPFFGDQFFWGKRIEDLGVGPTHMSIKNITVEKLSKSINALLTDQKMIQRAASIGEQIRSQDGVGRAVAAINRSISHYHKRTEKPEDKKKSPLMRITIDNRTPNYLRRIKWRMDRGSWGTLPPENIAPGSSETIHVQADSSYLFTGLEGWVVYCTKSISSPPHAPKNFLKRTRSDRAISKDEKKSPVMPKFGSKGPKPKTAIATQGSPAEQPALSRSGRSILKRSRSRSVGDVPTLAFNNVNHNNAEVSANNVNFNNGLLVDDEGEIIHVKNVTFAPEELAKELANENTLREPKRLSRALAKSSPANLLAAEKNTGMLSCAT
jgi:sterol 3beta-glucosyltransferase